MVYSMSTTTQTKKPLLCKYCNQVEITFSKGKVSKAGKMIPLNANSLEPHNCSQNPYNQQQKQPSTTQTQQPQQQQQPTQAQPTSPAIISLADLLVKLQGLETKMDHLQKLVYAQSETNDRIMKLLESKQHEGAQQ